MFRADMALHNLRNRLTQRVDQATVDSICDTASSEINAAISEIVSRYLDEAIQASQESGAEDLISSMQLHDSGTLQIVDTQHNFNFHEPPFPMLPHLLKNAKTAKDGVTKYAKIPITTKKKVAQSSLSVQEEMQRQRDAERVDQGTSRSTSSGLAAVNQALERVRMAAASRRGSVSQREPATEFRTASSKQDAQSKWVHPGRNISVMSQVQDINRRMNEEIEQTIQSIISNHERSV